MEGPTPHSEGPYGLDPFSVRPPASKGRIEDGCLWWRSIDAAGAPEARWRRQRAGVVPLDCLRIAGSTKHHVQHRLSEPRTQHRPFAQCATHARVAPASNLAFCEGRQVRRAEHAAFIEARYRCLRTTCWGDLCVSDELWTFEQHFADRMGLLQPASCANTAVHTAPHSAALHPKPNACVLRRLRVEQTRSGARSHRPLLLGGGLVSISTRVSMCMCGAKGD